MSDPTLPVPTGAVRLFASIAAVMLGIIAGATVAVFTLGVV